MKQEKKYLKLRKDVHCSCNKKQQDVDRAKYGTCRCDSYSFASTFGQILANALYQYLADAKCAIIREDFDIIEKHANAIQAYIDADSWDLSASFIDKDVARGYEYLEKERKWREAMFWLTENWNSLWW